MNDQSSNEIAPGVVIAAPSSGSGKTVVTLSLLRAFKNSGVKVGSFKVGPDYIDPAFHSAASGATCQNMDFWGMREASLMRGRAGMVHENELVITEGVMGLFDGASVGAASKASGSTADAAKWLEWPVVLIVDAQGQGASAAALIEGFANHRKDIEVAGVIFNRIGGKGHEVMLKEAAAKTGITCLGSIPRNECLALPSRHLGLVQAGERPELEDWLNTAAAYVAEHVDLTALQGIAVQSKVTLTLDETPPMPALGKHTAIARDEAFAFCYPHIVEGWRAAGTEISYFSPLAGQAPDFLADSIYLPGGYPELHAKTIAANDHFFEAMQLAATSGVVIYGECGGFMVLGETLTDREGQSHDMLGLLPVKTSFENPKLHLGYRLLALTGDTPLGKEGSSFKGHEFHYCEIMENGAAETLYKVNDAKGTELPEIGCRVGSVMGSFAHIIDIV